MIDPYTFISVITTSIAIFGVILCVLRELIRRNGARNNKNVYYVYKKHRGCYNYKSNGFTTVRFAIRLKPKSLVSSV